MEVAPTTGSASGWSSVIVSLLPIAALTLGWALSEISQAFRVRARAKGAIGRALSDLLEVRHQVKSFDAIVGVIQERYSISADATVKMMDDLEKTSPLDRELLARYERALSDLADTEPLLAFELRGKADLPFKLSQLRRGSLEADGSAEFVRLADSILRAETLPALEQAIHSLAWKHGISTWIRVRWRLRLGGTASCNFGLAALRYRDTMLGAVAATRKQGPPKNP